jgi:MoaA/NifB/PqqE/SkfB family radical SAM enzyme
MSENFQVAGNGEDRTSDLTVFFITTGEAIGARAWTALHKQTCKFRLGVIKNVSPMSAAFQRMVDTCETQYFIQVDEDMVLKPTAVIELYRSIRGLPDDVFMYAYMLWDVHLVRGIFGVKSYRRDLMRLASYHDTQSCEQDHFKQLQDAGYRYVVPGWDDATLTPRSPQVQGAHGMLYNPRSAYERYLDLTEKYRDVGGSDWYARYPMEFLRRLVGDEGIKGLDQNTDLWAFVGAVCGLATDLDVPRGEKDFTKPPRGYGEIRAHLVAPPRETIIYSTGRCNAKCAGCLRQAGSYEPTPDFTPELTTLMLDVFPSVDSCCVAGFGEPTLNKQLPQIMEILRRRGVCGGVITNGLRSVDSGGKLIPGLALASYVSFSLNAATEEEHARAYRVEGGWSKVRRGIDAAHAAGVPVTLSFIVTKQTWKDIPRYLRVSQELVGAMPGARVALVNYLPHGEPTNKEEHERFLSQVVTTDDDLHPALSECQTLAEELGLNVFVWPVPIDLSGPPVPGKCPSPFVRLGIDGYGNVSGCSRITPPSAEWGSITRQRSHVWMDSLKLRSLRRQLVGVEPLRHECRYCFGNWSEF